MIIVCATSPLSTHSLVVLNELEPTAEPAEVKTCFGKDFVDNAKELHAKYRPNEIHLLGPTNYTAGLAEQLQENIDDPDLDIVVIMEQTMPTLDDKQLNELRKGNMDLSNIVLDPQDGFAMGANGLLVPEEEKKDHLIGVDGKMLT